VALWSLLLFGVRLSWMQTIGIALSLLGVLTIILRGDFAALAAIELNRGDLMLASALCAFGLYSALMPKRPATHPLSLIVVTTGGGALLLLPFAIMEYAGGVRPTADWITAGTLVYVVIFPSMLAYLCFNRGVALIGPNRSAPF
ncbi:DMT family transporter, partial [Rhodopseudomonas sp. BR0G17]